jgi:hypothetical protein
MTHPQVRRVTPQDRRTSKTDRRRWAGLQEGSGVFHRGGVLVVMAVLTGLMTSAVLAVEGSGKIGRAHV